MQLPPHQFHIPVMGLAYTIDSPVKVAHFGITSAISIIEDNLVEMMRKYYYEQKNEPYIAISDKEEDYRARRITDYLNLVNRMVNEKFTKLKLSLFEPGSDLVKYFEMLPENHELKNAYHSMLKATNKVTRETISQFLRSQMSPGSIEVNIMTKVDKNNYAKDGTLMKDSSDALSALKGYAKSNLTNSSVIFSAGLNPRLYSYLEKFSGFDAKGWGKFDKKVVIKVSDYRSALIQGKFLAKKGVWVSEFRIESGLNCGGHAFATEGLLLGPILEEFKRKKYELINSLFEVYKPAVEAQGKKTYQMPHPIKLTVQGGIGTHEEDDFLHQHYDMDSTGWGSPFLLCTEATTVDKKTLQLLCDAGEKDVVLSKNSPLGVRFNYLKGTSSEEEKLERIKKGLPGSPCTEKYLVSNTEFTKEPICTASRQYQKFKIKELETSDLPEKERQKQIDEVLNKECLCIGLSNAASLEYDVPLVKRLHSVTVCPGPNIVNFKKVVTLREMVDHIYGRSNSLIDENRPHMFIRELRLYVDHIQEQVNECFAPAPKTVRHLTNFCKNLITGIGYYRDLTAPTNPGKSRDAFEKSLNLEENRLTHILEDILAISN
ncbi:hypothetical protein JMN32_15525 [Fulvivirga sp. 29W222]|uniref:Uncharacterized protein n=1 Tax=Fulvivirga marina TaxID=2494733 RepID=A0A937G097_9BACT|nr:hypothetical protein [Fulvivirga marina]MBL6447728.1 hypothetical protein [Fulvivirga marina]